MAPRLLEPFQLAQKSLDLLSSLCPSPASGSLVHCPTVLAGHVEPMQTGWAVHAECVVVSRTTWLTVLFQSWVHCTTLAPVGSVDSVNKQREEAGSWYLRTSGCCPSPRLPRPEEGAVYLVSTVAADCHLGALLLQGLLASWPCLGHHVMAAVSKGTDGSSASRAAPLARTLLRGLGKRARGCRAYPNRQPWQWLLLRINSSHLNSPKVFY